MVGKKFRASPPPCGEEMEEGVQAPKFESVALTPPTLPSPARGEGAHNRAHLGATNLSE